MTSGRRNISGVTVYQRGTAWAYLVELEPDPLTGRRRRTYRGGLESEEAALTEAIKAKATVEAGRHVKPSRRKVRELSAEWLASIQHSVKPTTFTNYSDYLDAYVLPIIGDRKLQEITVTALNALTRHLLENGRAKPDINGTMYKYWKRETDAGKDVTPRELATATGTTLYAAQSAVRRYKGGRVPKEVGRGLAPKTVRNIINMLHKMFGTAVAWHYIQHNPADHVSKPRSPRTRPKTWTAEQLGAFLAAAQQDRFHALWVLAATTGMRRSELAGVEIELLDLEKATLRIEPTRVVVAGKAIDEDGKTRAGRRTIALDPYTISALRAYLAQVAVEREAWGSDYPNHGKLFRYEDGRPLHPDRITNRFSNLVSKANLPHIRLHDVRHSYATIATDAGMNPKVLSERIGHASVSFTMQTYVQRSPGRDRDAAEAIAKLIVDIRPDET